MGANSSIQWTTHTWNPWWGCIRVSPACEHCYAEAQAKRYGHDIWGPEQTTARRFFGEKHWAEPLKWNRLAADLPERPRVFCASMADVFEDRRDLEPWRDQLWDLIEATPNLDWLLLTKRPENMVKMVPPDWAQGWPSNIWAGTTAEDQAWAEKRIPWLLQVPATIRFLSCEPLLGPIDFENLTVVPEDPPHGPGVWIDALRGQVKGPDDVIPHLNWVITGGESAGPQERRLVEKCERPEHEAGDCPRCRGTGWRLKPSDGLKWLRSIRDQCVDAGVAYLHKQNGGPHNHSGGRLLDGRTWDQFPTSVAEARA